TQGSTRDRDFGDLADLLAEQATAARAGRQDLVVLVVLVAGADQLQLLDLAGIEVLDTNPRSEDDRALGKLRGFDDDGSSETVVGQDDASLVHPLILAGGVVLGVLAEVTHP